MKCQKCGKDFEEKDIQESHDIPKYMGGTDKDGRHWLCKKCHDKYEFEVLKIGLMNWIKQLPPIDKIIFYDSTRMVKKYFFKGVKNDSIQKF